MVAPASTDWPPLITMGHWAPTVRRLPYRHDELDGPGKEGPDAEHEKGRPDGGEHGDDHSGGGGEAEPHVDGADAVRGAGCRARRRSRSVAMASHKG